MSFTKGKSLKIMGSSALRSQQYAGDYDGYETVELHMKTKEEALNWLANRFQEMIKELRKMKNVYIGDIKGGVIEDWRVIPKRAKIVGNKVEGYNAEGSRHILDRLVKSGIVTEGEAASVRKYIKESPSPADFILAKQSIKFHIIRWTPEQVLKGEVRLKDGRTFTLQDAFSSPGISKLDTIALVENNRYTDFSVIYQFKNNGEYLNYEKVDFVQSVRENIIALEEEGNPFKVLKRKFSLAKFFNKKDDLRRFSTILNSDLGRLYVVLGDIGTLVTLLEDHAAVPIEKVKFEIDQFKKRLSTIYTLEEYIKNEHEVLDDIKHALKQPTRARIVVALKQLGDNLAEYLREAAETKLTGGQAYYKRYSIAPSAGLL
jgi:hypothetical protein